jgi:hypothetical protein
MKKTIGILAVLFCLMFVSNALAVNLGWDAQTDSDGFSLYWYTGTTVIPTQKVDISGKTSVAGSIADSNFTVGTTYNIHATAWTNPVVSGGARGESLPSNVVPYTYRGTGGNNSVAPGVPTGLTLTGTNFTWIAPASASGIPVPVGYNVYYKLAPSSVWLGPTVVTGALLVPMATVNSNWTQASYTIKVKAWVWGVNGITPLEGGDSNIFTFTPGGGSGAVPKTPGGLQIK